MSNTALWRHAEFRRLYVSSASFVLGTQIYQLALPLIFYELTRSVSVMTQLRAVELLPNLLLALFVGVWVDRIDRGRWARRAMVGMVLLLGVQALLLPSGASMLPLFLGCTFLLMTLNYVYGICRVGLVKEMLPEALLLPATGQLTVVAQVAAVVGPALAGMLVAWRQASGLWLPMLALLLAAALLRGLALNERPKRTGSFWRDLREGFQVLVANRPLWQLSWLIVVINGSAGVAEVLLLFRVRDELQWTPAAMGLLYAAAGAGGVAGGWWCSSLRSRLGLGRLLLVGLSVEMACIAGLSFAKAGGLVMLLLTFNNAAAVVGNVCVWGYRQESTDSAFIGRISGLTGSLFKLAMPLALWLSGGLAMGARVGPLMLLCAGAHLVAVIGVRVSAVYPLK